MTPPTVADTLDTCFFGPLRRPRTRRVGGTIRSLADIMGYLESTSIYCVERGERYINFAPVPLRDYLRLGSVVGEYWDAAARIHRKCLISPMPSDVAWLRPFKFEDLTRRGTVEFRSVCEQPVREAFAAASVPRRPSAHRARLLRKPDGDQYARVADGHGGRE